MSEITLFTPGPTHMPERVLQAMHRSGDHHRTPEFRALFQETRTLLQEAFIGSSMPLLLCCSGSGGMESLICTGLSTSDVLGYLDAGKFGNRWGAVAQAHGVKTVSLTKEWGQSPTIEEVRAFLTAHPTITHFAMQYCETSTTVLHDVPAVSTLLREEFPHVLFFVDAISAATTLSIDLSELHVDGLVLASQKAFMLPPGLSMLFLSERFWNHAANHEPRSLYFNLHKEQKAQEKGNAAWTPALSIIFGLRESLQVFIDEGWSNVFARHAACSAISKEQFQKLGFQPVTENHLAPGTTGGFPPEGVDPDALRSKLFENHGLRTAGGQDHWKGKVLRVGHMGVIAPDDVSRCFQALSEVM